MFSFFAEKGEALLGALVKWILTRSPHAATVPKNVLQRPASTCRSRTGRMRSYYRIHDVLIADTRDATLQRCESPSQSSPANSRRRIEPCGGQCATASSARTALHRALLIFR